MNNRILIVCTTDSMIWNFLVPHIKQLENDGCYVECACSITGDFFKNLIDMYDIKMNEIPFERSPYNKKNFSAYKALCKLIKEKNFDTIYCHEPVGGALGRLAGHASKCNVIYIAHGFHFFKGAPLVNKYLYYCIEKFLSRYTDVLVTINEEDYRASQKFYAKKTYKINGIGIDTQKFSKVPNSDELRKILELEKEDFILLSVGELSKRKNHSIIIDALKKIDNLRIHYVIVGDGELHNYLKEKIKDSNLENQVHLIGYRTDVYKLCNSADVFIMPSLQEGLSVALMEAMASGLPCVASKIRGNVDLIEEGKGGFLCAPDDVSGFAEAINKIATDEELRKNMQEYNKEAIKKFDISVVKAEMEKIYSEVFN